MTRTQRVRYEMLQRVRDFGASQIEAFPESSTGGQHFARVAQAIERIDAHTTATLLAANDGRRARIAARVVVRRRMLAIARTARDLARGTPALEKSFRMPRRDSDVALLTSARAFRDRGEPIRDDLVRLGLSVTCLAELHSAINTLEAGMADRRSGRSRVAHGQAAITEALTEGMDAARTLDVIVTNTLEEDPALFARWQRDRRLVDSKSKDPAPADPAIAAPAALTALDKAS